MSRRLRALLLAAGKGERLRPLTAALPKPLLPVAGRPLIAHTLEALVAAGCEAIAVNLHHLGEAIAAAVGESWRGVPIRYSREPEILGTLGAVAPLADFFAGCDALVLVNGDSLCRWPLADLVERHFRSGAAATLLTAERADPAEFGGGLALDGGGDVLAFRGGLLTARLARRRAVFAGAHLWQPRLVERARPLFSDSVRDLFEPLLAEGERIATLATRRPWFDLGTPARYLEAARAWALSPLAAGENFVAAGAAIAAGADVRGAVLETNSAVAAGATLRSCLLLPGARVGAGARLIETIVGPGVELPPGSEATGMLFTRDAAGGTAATPLHGSLAAAEP